MLKKPYKIKKTLSMRQFIAEFGDDFSKHMKQRLMELGERCVLTRGEDRNRLDLKHIEHHKFNSEGSKDQKKEYTYGQFLLKEGEIYFSQNCAENADTMKAPVACTVYDSLQREEHEVNENSNAKKIDDENIDFVIDSILEVCPELSKEHLAILSKY